MAVVCRVLVGVMVETWAPLRYVARMFCELAISSTGGRSTGSGDTGEKGQGGPAALWPLPVRERHCGCLAIRSLRQAHLPFLALQERLSGCSRYPSHSHT